MEKQKEINTEIVLDEEEVVIEDPIKDSPNVISVENLCDEDKNLLISKRKPKIGDSGLCPSCGMDTIQEETMGYEKEYFCTTCSYFTSKTL